VAENFAEIFFGNCTTLGIPCACAAREDIAKVAAAVAADPSIEVTIDVDAEVVRFGNNSIPASIRDTARDALLNGRWDAIAELAEGKEAVKTVAASLPYMAS
jgi:3-isopropylmalate/(R)-2-methylmalate dehydratase small subunit